MRKPCPGANRCRCTPMPRKPTFRIGRSRTGLGLFATAPIKKRAFIVEYKGRKLTTEQAEKLEARGNRYLYEINSRWTIDGTTRKNLGRYANHSCRPNAEVPPDRAQGLPARHQEHQPRRRNHLQLRPRLFPQCHHATRLQMREVPGEAVGSAREGPGQEPARQESIRQAIMTAVARCKANGRKEWAVPARTRAPPPSGTGSPQQARQMPMKLEQF